MLGGAGNQRSTAISDKSVAAIDTIGRRSRLIDLGLEIPSREQQTPEGFAVLQKADIERWWPIIKAANIKPE
jgi:hypothetical protein